MPEAGPSSRPTTPPSLVDRAELQLTPEQVRLVEVNRLKAKARLRQSQQETLESTATSNLNANGKRPIAVTPASSNSPTAPKPSNVLKRDSRLGTYYDYDLSKMINSKGGFLVEEGKEVDENMIRKEKEREQQRAMQNLEPPIFLESSRNPKCCECQSMYIDQTFRQIFGCLVCHKCKDAHPEKYSLLTKTECKQDYLLTDPELRDQEALPHLLRANPHKSTFANMMLFLRYQVETFAWNKWGSPEALDAEYERRIAEKKKKRNKKFEEGLRDLRRKTREGVWQKRHEAEHRHEYGEVEMLEGVGKQVCKECGFAIEVEEL